MLQAVQALENLRLKVDDRVSFEIQKLQLTQASEYSGWKCHDLIAWNDQTSKIRSVHENIFLDSRHYGARDSQFQKIVTVAKDSVVQSRNGICWPFKEEIRESFTTLDVESLQLKIASDKHRVQVGESIVDHFRKSRKHSAVIEVDS